YLVNIHKIKTFTSNEITMNSDYRLPISRGCQKEFEEVYFATLFGKAGEL
ncbi:MAG: LytTR family transcriptional regulator DNA-binding domain-containing protein, partial [Oscillospiraceae bacterium]|nr:LytTR family transcriptional regulator DNA-binding domain-containing protein [Oscillospiraceae bacterium]